MRDKDEKNCLPLRFLASLVTPFSSLAVLLPLLFLPVSHAACYSRLLTPPHSTPLHGTFTARNQHSSLVHPPSPSTRPQLKLTPSATPPLNNRPRLRAAQPRGLPAYQPVCPYGFPTPKAKQ
jgi:hypothetical protein